MNSARNNYIHFYIIAYWHDSRFKKQVGGPIKIYELATNLKELGHRVFLFIPKIGHPEQQTSAKVFAIPLLDFPVVRFISFQIFAFLTSLSVMIIKGRPDIFYVRIMWSFLPMLLGKLLRIPVILDVNDSPHRGYAKIKNGLKCRLVHFIDRISYRLSEHVLSVTKNIADDLHVIEGLSWKSMTVVPSGANTELFRPLNKSSCCKRLGFDLRKKYVGFIGTFFHHQGIEVFVDSAPLIIQEGFDVHFLLVGDGPIKADLQRKVAEMGLRNYFSFTGQVQYKDVPSYCGVMDICVSPFLKEARESSAVKVFDYFACGKPVVMSDISNTGRHFLESGAAALVKPEDPVELANAIKELLSDLKESRIMGKKGRQFVIPRYDRKNLARDIARLCQEIVASRQR